MTHVIFGGSNGIGKRIINTFLTNTNDGLINIDLNQHDFGSRCQNITGDLTSKEFEKNLLNSLEKVKLESIVWSIRAKVNAKSTSNAIKDCLSIEFYPLVDIFDLLLPKIIQDNTNIVILSSIAAELVSAQHCAYNITKSAVETFVKTQSVRIGKVSKARINIVRPGVVHIQERSKMLDLDVQRNILEQSSIPRLSPVKAEEIAELVFFLSSNKSSALNGSIVVADG